MDIQVSSSTPFNKNGNKTAGSGCLMLFGLPFALIGVFCLGWIGKSIFEYYDMQSWSTVDAIVTSADLEAHHGDDSTTYQAKATYEYEFEGVKYTGDRVALMGGADNIGNFQQDSAEILKDHLSSKKPITVYVNPKDPKSSIVFRDLRYGQFTLIGIFGLIFGGVGFGLILGTLWYSKSERARAALKKRYPGEPWKANPKWQTSTLVSDNKGQFLTLLIFGTLWNLVSLPVAIFVPAEIIKSKNYILCLAFLFPLIGVLFIIGIFRTFVQWRKFGKTSVTLTPFPAELKNQLKGTVKIPAELQSGTKDAKGVIKCSRTEKRRTSKGGTESTSVQIWSKEFPLVIESFRTMSKGTNATFTVELPDEITAPPTDEEAYEPIGWELQFSADIPGVDFYATFAIPVIKRF